MKARRRWAGPLVPVYAAGLWVKDGLRRVGLLRTRRLAWPVVSVGSLSAGGAGKTPVVIALVESLQRRGWEVDVLSRGYGRAGSGVELVDVGAEGAAERFGDEPVVIGRRAGVDVWVGADRYAAGVTAEGGVAGKSVGGGEENNDGDSDPGAGQNDASKNGGWRGDRGQEGRAAGIFRYAQNDKTAGQNDVTMAQNDSSMEGERMRRVHLLDDGFQHRRLGRAVDVVVVTEEDLEDMLLPAGNRREGLRALGRADVVVVREEECERIEGVVRRDMRGDARLWVVRRRLRFTGAAGLVGAGLRPVAFCGIARPDGFFAMLRNHGSDAVATVAFGDHHRYTGADVERLVKMAGDQQATGFITTEKDAVKLTAEMRSALERVGSIVIAQLDAVFADEAAVVRDVESKIGEARPG